MKDVISKSITDSKNFELQYVSFASNENMIELENEITDEILKEEGVCISLAAKLGTTRLIDNIVLGGNNK